MAVGSSCSVVDAGVSVGNSITWARLEAVGVDGSIVAVGPRTSGVGSGAFVPLFIPKTNITEPKPTAADRTRKAAIRPVFVDINLFLPRELFSFESAGFNDYDLMRKINQSGDWSLEKTVWAVLSG
jgi:hypothetical protein